MNITNIYRWSAEASSRVWSTTLISVYFTDRFSNLLLMHITTLKTSHTINLKGGFYSHFKQTMYTKFTTIKSLGFLFSYSCWLFFISIHFIVETTVSSMASLHPGSLPPTSPASVRRTIGSAGDPLHLLLFQNSIFYNVVCLERGGQFCSNYPYLIHSCQRYINKRGSLHHVLVISQNENSLNVCQKAFD